MKSKISVPKLITILAVVLSFSLSVETKAQNVALKTNLAYDAVAAANLGLEFGLAPKWTLDISGNYMPWNFYNGLSRKHAFAQPEARFWFCDRFAGHFLGIHAHGGLYNMTGVGVLDKIPFLPSSVSRLDEERHQGWFAGAGIAYGYAVILGKHWNLEFEIGAGYAYTKYDIFECAECGSKLGQEDHHYVGLTKAAINLVYVF
ncbi:MAG: DUF3575 domain-containing protein [Candidatus Cryptobacteroides sp.]